MPPKKHIIIIGVLCVIALGLGYVYGKWRQGSGQVPELLANANKPLKGTGSKGDNSSSTPENSANQVNDTRSITTTIPVITTTPTATWPATGFAFFPNSKKITLLSKGWSVWDIQSGKKERQLAMDGSKFVGFGPEPKHNVWTINQTQMALQSVNPQTWLLLSKLLQFDASSAKLSENHKWLAVGSRNAIDLWKIDGINFVKRPSMTAQGVRHFAFNSDGTKLAVNFAYSGKLVCWDLLQMKVIFTKTFGYLGNCAFSPDGKLLIAPEIASGKIHVLRADDGGETKPLIGHKGGALDVDFSHDGRHLISCGSLYARGSKADGTIRVWDMQKREQMQSWQSDGFPGVYRVKFSRDGKWLASYGGNPGTVKLWKVTRQ